MTITSKYAGTCRNCHQPINVGDQINWQRGAGSTHLKCPTATPDEPTREITVTEPGVYENDHGIYIVKPNQTKTRLYAKQLVEINAERALEDGGRVQIEFEYAPGAIYHLLPEHKMPLDRAKELTIRYGRCIVCGAHLKAAQSVERGIGPVCIKSFRIAIPC